MTDLLAELNRDLWHPFVAAYATLDAAAFLALNRPDLIRVSAAANQVQGYDGYATDLRAFFAMVAGRGDRIGIGFRFHERMAAGDLASERGLFRLSVVPAEGEPRARYGRFHTCARKSDGRWRFVVDYDTTENADEAAFDAGADIDDVARFA
jgi:ketosteroid isomerase-like protein